MRGVSNRALASLLQRKVGWTDASTQGNAWNQDERQVGKVRRIPLEGLGEGLDAAVPKRAKTEGREIPELSSEKAKGKAIVLVPAALDATKSIEVVVFLHGWTEGVHRPFAGYRALDTTPSLKDVGKALKERLPRLRQGLDAKDTAPVRDVSLDYAEAQLEESGQTQLVVILPQGGLHSQFGKAGGKEFDATPFVNEVVTRLKTEKRWRDAAGAVVDAEPSVTRITMSGHSGAGATLSKLTQIPGDLVIYDAINGSELNGYKRWVTTRLDEDYQVLMDPWFTESEKLLHVKTAQKLRGYTTDFYIDQYIALDDHIAAWFAKHPKLGAWAPCLRANYFLDYLDVDHEELMRGAKAGTPRVAGTGTLLDAIKGLHAPQWSSPGACPAIPKSLRERYKAAKAPKKR